jgi:transposase
MEEVSVIGIDLAKQVFQLCALSPSGAVVWHKRLRRQGFMRFLETRAPRCVVGLEACGGAHYWARWLSARGFTPKLMAPKAVKAYRQGPHKNDMRDARAVAEAASRPYVAAVQVKSEAAQAVQALMRVRERRIRQRVQTTNQLRGLLHEFGLVLPKGHARMLAAIARLERDGALSGLPETVRVLVDTLGAEIAAQAEAVAAATRALEDAVAADDGCERLMSIPHIGPINAAALSVALEVPEAFRNGRAFAAHLGLVPRQHASADNSVLLGVARQSANQMRRYLVLAAQGLLTRVQRLEQPPTDPLLLWARALLERKNRNVAAVAVAGKLARIAWAVAATDQDYRAGGAGR